nr:DNA-directed RNA polymerases I, II and III [Cryptomonas sp.]
MDYYCLECGSVNEILACQPILCKYCGARILYKTRTRQVLQYEARRK